MEIECSLCIGEAEAEVPEPEEQGGQGQQGWTSIPICRRTRQVAN